MMAGEFAGVNPEIWQIIDGELYLGWDKKGMQEFSQNASANIEQADHNWSRLAISP